MSPVELLPCSTGDSLGVDDCICDPDGDVVGDADGEAGGEADGEAEGTDESALVRFTFSGSVPSS